MTNKIVNVVASTQLTDTLDLYDIADILDKDYEESERKKKNEWVEENKDKENVIVVADLNMI